MRSGSGQISATGSRSSAWSCNAEKTRLIEFGRFAAERRQAHGRGKPETFEFLGFTHMLRAEQERTVQAQANHRLEADADEAARGQGHAHQAPGSAHSRTGPLAGQRPARALNYYAVPDNYEAINAFRQLVIRHWLKALRRRSQRPG